MIRSTVSLVALLGVALSALAQTPGGIELKDPKNDPPRKIDPPSRAEQRAHEIRKGIKFNPDLVVKHAGFTLRSCKFDGCRQYVEELNLQHIKCPQGFTATIKNVGEGKSKPTKLEVSYSDEARQPSGQPTHTKSVQVPAIESGHETDVLVPMFGSGFVNVDYGIRFHVNPNRGIQETNYGKSGTWANTWQCTYKGGSRCDKVLQGP